MKEDRSRWRIVSLGLMLLLSVGGCEQSNKTKPEAVLLTGKELKGRVLKQPSVNSPKPSGDEHVEQAPRTAKEHYEAGLKAKNSDKSTKAIEHFTAAIELDHQMIEARSQLGALLLAAERYIDASILYGRLAEEYPQDASIRDDWGVVLTQVGDFEDAIKQFHKAIELEGEHSDAHYNLATALLNVGLVTESKEHLIKVLRLRPSYTDAYFTFGRLHLMTEEFEDAIAQFQHVMKLDREYNGLDYELGRAYSRQGNVKKAVLHFSEAVRRDPFRAEPRFALGRALASYGNYNAAKAQFLEVIRLEPESPDALLELGKTFAQIGDYQKAITKNNAALALRPDWPEALNNQAWLLATVDDPKLRDSDRALELAQRAKQLADYKRPLVLDTLAAAQAAAGEFEDAAKTAEEAAEWAKKLGNESIAEEILQRAEQYRTSKPYREPSPATK